jgi:hypothetical protein
MTRQRPGARLDYALAASVLAFAFACRPLTAQAASLERAVPRQLTAEEIAALPRDGSRLILRPVAFDPLRASPDFAAVGLPTKAAGQYGLVQFAPGALDEKERLEKRGVRFFGYIPDNAFQAKLTPAAAALLSNDPAVRWFGPYAPGFKVSPRLWASSKDPNIEVTVVLFADASLDAVEQALANAFPAAVRTARREDDTWPRLRFAVPDSQRPAFAAAAAALDGTAWIEPRSRAVLFNNDSLGPIQSNAATVLAPGGGCTSCGIFNHGITGTGQIAAIADSGLDDDMCFFRYSASPSDVTDAETTLPPLIGTLSPGKKVVGYWVQPGATAYDNNESCGGPGNETTFHGTHTTGTLAGDNFATLSTPSSPGIDVGDGMAPNAKILFQDIGDDTTGCLEGGDPYEMYQQALGAGARVHSNSYGEDSAGPYDTWDQEIDRFLYDHEEMAIFFSAGNDGPASGTIHSPGNAKNVVSVGATIHGNSPTIASFSSRGPTADGRVKPDIVAPGFAIVSALGDASHDSNNCGTQALSGTSMACPTAAGAATLLREYFADGFYPTGAATASDQLDASAPLVKAVLLNGTLPLGTFGENTFGWGRVFLDNNLYFSGDARKLRVWNVANTQGLTAGQSQTYTVKVSADQEFRATLVWFDPEGTPGAGVMLVNNLDLSVSDGTNTYLGNVVDANGASTTGGAADVLNSVEQVRLAAPTAGTYAVTVRASTVPGNGRPYTNRQGYALVVSSAGCATSVGAAPGNLAAASNSIMGASLSWTPAPGSTATQVYRAPGDCSASAASFQYVGASAGSSFTDSRAQGGSSYAYRVRGVDACGEGPVSACVSLIPTGRCDLLPTFVGIASASASGTSCVVHLSWGAAAARCLAAAPVRYNVYRSTASDFTPSLSNWIATTSAQAIDDESVVSGTTYYYVVRAEDSSTGGSGPNGGNEEGNLARVYATADGPLGAFGTWSDDGGDTAARLRAESPWQVSRRQAQAGTSSYHSGPEQGTYPDNACAAVTTPDLVLGVGSVLTYYGSYNLEYQWDGVIVEISSDGGATWSDLPPAAGYPDTLSQTQGNGCDYPATQGAFTGPSDNGSLVPWAQYTNNLSPTYDNKTVRIRWRFTSDPAAEYDGFFLDTISVTNVRLPGPCVPIKPPVNQAPVARPRTRPVAPHVSPRPS